MLREKKAYKAYKELETLDFKQLRKLPKQDLNQLIAYHQYGDAHADVTPSKTFASSRGGGGGGAGSKQVQDGTYEDDDVPLVSI